MQESDCLEWRLWNGPICVRCLSAEGLSLDTIWGKFEEFGKPVSNEVRACFDLLTSFRQANKSVDEWCNVV